MQEIQAWLDEERELRALGDEKLGSGYKITALKKIAPDLIRNKISEKERQYIQDGLSTEQMWTNLFNYTMSIARDEFLEVRDSHHSHHDGAPECAHHGAQHPYC